VWTASFHPEEAISLSYRAITDYFHTGETWEITNTMKFPVPSI